jgi:hypothetical protein
MFGIVGMCKVIENQTDTTYLFGDIKQIANKNLRILEKNRLGDCLCFDSTGSNLVDVSHVDVEKTVMFQ